MTPAVTYLEKQNIPFKLHEYRLDGTPGNYGQAVADALNVGHERLFKTLMVSLNGEAKQLAVCIIPVATTLNLKAAAGALNVKKIQMADPIIAEKTTGYVVGGISPFGQKKRLTMILDNSALNFDTIFASAGKRGLQIEFAPSHLLTALSVQCHPICS